ncbi:ABC transporter ATP-binding protein [Gorillibacterium sp. CAU 1737]|uniref:ABC transporter ATP-binding protein n=1 Tax=Gorillibacterium sp. CAU 1737 TaxID=3140362 RepID=UPI0032612F77
MLKLFRNLKPYTTAIVFILVFVLMQSLAELYLPTLMADIVDKGIVQSDNAYIYRIGGYMLAVAFVSMICAVLSTYLSAKVGMGFGRDLRNKVFGHVEKYSLREFDKIGTASLITRTTNDITQVQNITIMIFRMMVMAPMMSIGGMVMALNKDTTLSWIFAVVIPLLGLAIFAIVGTAMPHFKAMQKKVDKINLVVREELTGIRVIRAFNRIDREKKRFTAANADLTGTAIKVNKIMAFMMPVMMIVMNITTIGIIWFGSIRIDEGNMQVGSLMAFLQYAFQIMFSLIMMSMMFVMLPRASASAIRINEVLDMKSDIADPATSKAAATHGHVEFDNVTFSFPGAEQPAVKGISFHAGPGETTAIIGGTGSGKSTIINLIPRFYDIDSGSVKVNGVDVREMSQETLRAKIGYVPQKAMLFTGTITENIRYGKEDATDEEIRHAAEVAQAADFIGEMKEGYESIISQGGTNVSGGQKQRLSIARALVRKPEIYIFDDSFSALDFKTDAKLRAALKGETAEATVLIVAQRVSTVMDADRIIVLDEGEIAGIGTHKELMSTCEVYREIVSSQLSEEEIA